MANKALTPLILLALLGAMGAWIYFYELEGEEARLEAEAAQKRVLNISRDDVTGVKVINENGTFEAIKEDGSWRLTAPIEAAASKETLEDIVAAATDFESTRTLKDATGRLSTFGLQEPFATLVISTDTLSHTLAFGSQGAFEGHYYLRRDDETDVLMSNDPIRGLLDNSLTGFRNKKILPVPSRDIVSFRIEGETLPGLSAAKDGPAWRAAGGGVDFRLTKRAIDDLLFDLSALTAIDFLAPGEEAAAFETPYARIEVESQPSALSGDEAQAQTWVMIIGASFEDDGLAMHPVRREGLDEIYVVAASALKGLDVTVDELRDRAPVALDRWRIDHATAKLDGQTFTASKADGRWTMEPEDAPWAPTDVPAMLELLLKAEAEAFVEAAGADRAAMGLAVPRVELSFRAGDDGAPTHLRIGQSDGSASYVEVEGDETIYRMSERFLAQVVAQLSPKIPEEYEEVEGDGGL